MTTLSSLTSNTMPLELVQVHSKSIPCYSLLSLITLLSFITLTHSYNHQTHYFELLVIKSLRKNKIFYLNLIYYFSLFLSLCIPECLVCITFLLLQGLLLTFLKKKILSFLMKVDNDTENKVTGDGTKQVNKVKRYKPLVIK